MPFDLATAKPIKEEFDLASAKAMTHTGSYGESKYGKNLTPAQERIARDVLEPMSGPERFAAGAGMNLARMGRYMGNKLGVVSDKEVADAAALDKPLEQSPGGGAGDFAGGMAWTAPIGMGATSGVGTLGKLGAAIARNPISRGALEGAVQGGIQSPKGETLQGMGGGAMAGALLPAAVKAGQMATNGVSPTAAAQSLMAQGVDLTPGQMNPNGVMNHIESTWQSAPIIGPMISTARKNAENQYKQALIKEAAAPGAKLSNTTDMNALLDEAYKSFDPAYAPAKGFPIQTNAKGVPVTGVNRTLSNDFVDAAADKNILASDETRSTAKDWLQNQLTKQPKDTGDLLAMRSQLRSKIRSIKGETKDDQATREIFSNAEHSVTAALDSWLPADVSAAVKAADAQYGKFKIVENAVAKGGDKEFTTFQASKAVREATDKGEYARGGGRMRDLTSAGAETFADTPQTGARLAAIGIPAAIMAKTPAVGIPVALGAAGLTLTKTGRNLSAGNTAVQKWLQSIPTAALNNIPPQAQALIEQIANRAAVQSLDKRPGTNAVATP